jgi:large subunit ribosomal protein L4
MKTKVLTLDAKSAGDIELSDAVFGLEPREDILHRVVVWQLAKRRAGTRKTKTRGEISATTKKMYRQKGTGSARHGAQSAPQFRGGGKAMAPVVRSHAYDLPKKVRALGLKHALSAKAKEDKLIVVDEFTAKEVKTKATAKQLSNFPKGRLLLVDGKFDDKFALSARNLPNISFSDAGGLNVYDILKNDTLMLSKAAVQALEARLA